MGLAITPSDVPDGTSDVPLTSLERSVLTLAATGRGVAEVATLLDQPADTVRGSQAAAIVKLGARSKLEAVIIALRSGIIELPESTAQRVTPATVTWDLPLHDALE